MRKSSRLCLLCCLILTVSSLGCRERCGTSTNSAPNGAVESSESTESNGGGDETLKPEVDDTPLDVDNPKTPEGVVNSFFKTFFSGDDDGAFALLTSRAQEAKRDQFSAQESDTVRWRITKKMKPIQGRVLVFVDVEDYTDSGSIQLDELTFVLTNVDAAWRIAGFSVGELAINFEEEFQEVIVENDEPNASDAPKTARAEEASSGTYAR